MYCKSSKNKKIKLKKKKNDNKLWEQNVIGSITKYALLETCAFNCIWIWTIQKKERMEKMMKSTKESIELQFFEFKNFP